ncbi:uncharacterized protein CTRU02_209556 [Colletotrichum truncatum]|uniref:Uncharacterized protein n=1 Tax=Colletotrichum truncatum TaxID=5467 RepID=A0ACC3YSU4_COLTU|nr:uncharacterized protein CTRU02_14482 [Colletotrichum truncatum]KAF6782152.1 hypothetical protein CTRU02_14482 [Colletotrichum truncatum]
MDKIIQVNETRRTNLQQRWHNFPEACGRPAPDLDIPIVCIAGHHTHIVGDHLESAGADFDTFEHCCPSIQNRSNIYTTGRQCDFQTCFTHQTEVALNWEACVMDAAGKKMSELEAKGRKFNFTKEEAFHGRCEWIDYASLRRELKYDKSAAVPLSVSKFVVLALSIAPLLIDFL